MHNPIEFSRASHMPGGRDCKRVYGRFPSYVEARCPKAAATEHLSLEHVTLELNSAENDCKSLRDVRIA